MPKVLFSEVQEGEVEVSQEEFDAAWAAEDPGSALEALVLKHYKRADWLTNEIRIDENG